MKIGEGMRNPQVDLKKGSELHRSPQLDKMQFGELVKGHEQRMSQERLTQLLNDIDRQSQILSRSRSIRDFYVYKNLVKKFMEEAVRFGIALEDRKGMNRRGRSRLYKIIKEVDEQLVQLADDLISDQAPMIDLLQRIGEIRGLLINFYF